MVPAVRVRTLPSIVRRQVSVPPTHALGQALTIRWNGIEPDGRLTAWWRQIRGHGSTHEVVAERMYESIPGQPPPPDPDPAVNSRRARVDAGEGALTLPADWLVVTNAKMLNVLVSFTHVQTEPVLAPFGAGTVSSKRDTMFEVSIRG